MKKSCKIILSVLSCVFILIGFLSYTAANWCRDVYGDISFSAVLFTLFSKMDGVDKNLINDFIKRALIPALLYSAPVCLLLLWVPKRRLSAKIKNKEYKVYPFSKPFATVFAVSICIGLMANSLMVVKADVYFKGLINSSTIFEDEYVSPKNAEITFPKEKRNLIYIYMESMENTFFSKEQGGYFDKCLIPEMYSLAENNVNFSQNSTVGGMEEIEGGGWTMGALMTQTSGVPYKLLGGIDHNFEKSTLRGAVTITDVLKENGYYQTFMCGSDADFGGRKGYFEKHNIDKIYDLFSARADGIVPPEYHDGFWGMEDKFLYSYAKKEISEISKMEKPFAFYMLTVDTHHIGGKLCDKCGNEYSEQYENVYSCASKQINEFVSWIKAQPFYENTTVVIVGDHHSMDGEYFQRTIGEAERGKIYNCFINSAIDTEYSKNRTATQLDMFPTTLAAMGVKINGDRLGLGVNLFSGEETLAEKYGFNELQEKLRLYSKYYAKYLR